MTAWGKGEIITLIFHIILSVIVTGNVFQIEVTRQFHHVLFGG